MIRKEVSLIVELVGRWSVALACTACGVGGTGRGHNDGGLITRTVRKTYGYRFVDTSCETEEQLFNSRAELCEGLKSQSRNHYCAMRDREMYFRDQGCSGTFELEK